MEKKIVISFIVLGILFLVVVVWGYFLFSGRLSSSVRSNELYNFSFISYPSGQSNATGVKTTNFLKDNIVALTWIANVSQSMNVSVQSYYLNGTPSTQKRVCTSINISNPWWYTYGCIITIPQVIGNYNLKIYLENNESVASLPFNITG